MDPSQQLVSGGVERLAARHHVRSQLSEEPLEPVAHRDRQGSGSPTGEAAEGDQASSEAGGSIEDVVAEVDRQEGGSEAIRAAGLAVISVFGVDELRVRITERAG